MLNNLNTMFFLILLTSTIFSISTSTWISTWMGLELNLFSFVPFMVELKNILSNESALNYFLVQASSSSLFIIFCILNSLNSISLTLNLLFIQNSLSSLPLIIKLGTPPFQSWFIFVIEGMNWMKCFILMTWQKIIPLIILSYIFMNKTLLLLYSIYSLAIGSIGALNQTSLRKILAFSSINHLGWLICSLTFNKILMSLYFLLYFLLNLFLVFNFKWMSIFQFNQKYSISQFTPLLISILSLAGLPPFLGFLPKWLIVQFLIFNHQLLMPLILILFASITLFYYFRMSYKTLILSSSKQKWMNKFNKIYFYPKIFISLMTLTTTTGLMMFNLILT